MKLKLLLIISAMFLANSAFAATYYISPGGSNSGDGSSGGPWKTFSFAIPKLNPGDTLMLASGNYTSGTTGLPNISCSGGAKNGTASAPITIQAQNERQAWLHGDGPEVLGIRNCSYWNIVGLHISNVDVLVPPSAEVFVGNSNHINFRRNLITNANRRSNQSVITYNTCDYGLIEENEIYDYLRHGFLLAHTSHITVRRNYANSRNYPSLGSIVGVTDATPGGDSLVAAYPGSYTLVENNISEGCTIGAYSLQASDSGGFETINNRFYGNISLNDLTSLRIRARQNYLDGMPKNTYIENHVAIGSGANAGDFRANKDTVVTNTSIFTSGASGYLGSTPEFVGDGSPTISIKNSLAVSNRGAGFSYVNYASFKVANSNSFGNNPNYSPGSLAAGNMSVDPKFGTCKVFVPEYSPMKGAGANGDDIGANVLCRYQDGVLTKQQLWDWTTGQFPCGAIVSGVNNIAGSSCFDVNKRLNVNANGCTLPANPSCNQPSGTPPVFGGTGPGLSACCQ